MTLDAEPLRSRLTAWRIVPMTVVIDVRGRLMRSIPGEMAEAPSAAPAKTLAALKQGVRQRMQRHHVGR